jgi:signal peptidase II
MNTHQKTPNALVWLVLSVALILLDQWTKHIATANLQYGESVPFIAGVWDWTLARRSVFWRTRVDGRTGFLS